MYNAEIAKKYGFLLFIMYFCKENSNQKGTVVNRITCRKPKMDHFQCGIHNIFRNSAFQRLPAGKLPGVLKSNTK